MEYGDMLVVDSGASDPPLAPPAVTASAHSTTAATGAGGGTHQRCPMYEVLLSNEQLNYKRLDALLKSEPAEIRKALQQVREHGPPPLVKIAWIDSSIASLRLVFNEGDQSHPAIAECTRVVCCRASRQRSLDRYLTSPFGWT